MVQLSPLILSAWLTPCSLWGFQPVAIDLLKWGGSIKKRHMIRLNVWKASGTATNTHAQQCTCQSLTAIAPPHCVSGQLNLDLCYTWYENVGCYQVHGCKHAIWMFLNPFVSCMLSSRWCFYESKYTFLLCSPMCIIQYTAELVVTMLFSGWCDLFSW